MLTELAAYIKGFRSAHFLRAFATVFVSSLTRIRDFFELAMIFSNAPINFSVLPLVLVRAIISIAICWPTLSKFSSSIDFTLASNSESESVSSTVIAIAV